LVLAMAVCVAVASSGCSASSSLFGRASADSGDEAAVVAAHEALIAAYEAGDVDAFVALLDPTPDLLIYHPRLVHRYAGIDQVTGSLPRMFKRLQGASWLDAHASVNVDGSVAWLNSHVLIEAPGLDEPFAGRGTEVWVKRSGGWRLAHGHWSVNPEYHSRK
jgi:ketosteroid isomerase-like protein